MNKKIPEEKRNSLKTYFSSRYTSNTSGCWLWTGPRGTAGYGQMHGLMAHRVSYFLRTREDPGVLMVCHKCDVPLCVNPEHLFLRTSPKGPEGEKVHTAKLSEKDVLDIRRRYLSGERTKCLGKEYGIAQATILNVAKGRTWKNVPMMQGPKYRRRASKRRSRTLR